MKTKVLAYFQICISVPLNCANLNTGCTKNVDIHGWIVTRIYLQPEIYWK